MIDKNKTMCIIKGWVAKQTNWTSSPVAYLLSHPSKSFSIADKNSWIKITIVCNIERMNLP